MGHSSTLTLSDTTLLHNIHNILLILRLKPTPKPHAPFPFTHLPLELQLLITSFLPPLDLYTLRLTCSFYASLIVAPKLKDFLELEEEEWEKARPWPEGGEGKAKAPKDVRWMACCGCARYRPVKSFGREQRDAVVKRPGHALWSCRLCWGCQVGRWKS